MALIEYLTDNYLDFGCELKIVTNQTHSGAQFVNGFGGIGGILRYVMNFDLLDAGEEYDEEDLDEFDLEDY